MSQLRRVASSSNNNNDHLKCTGTTTTTTTTRSSSKNQHSNSSVTTIIMYSILGLVLLSCTLLLTRTLAAVSEQQQQQREATTTKPKVTITPSELSELLTEIRGDDFRIVRWDASSHTRKMQRRDKHCGDIMLAALDMLTSPTTSDNVQAKADACEYATFCITDNPKQRSIFGAANHGSIHKQVVGLILSEDKHLSAMASHLVYISSFANAVNHQGFYNAGAVQALETIVKKQMLFEKDSSSSNENENNKNADDDWVQADQIMWSAAALQNLAASYCEGTLPQDGRCYWHWADGDSAQIDKRILPVFADGTSTRQLILEDKKLVQRLQELSCMGPVEGKRGRDENPFPGQNAVIEKDDNSPTIVAWAATGALKNLALESKALPLIQDSVRCYCEMYHSRDWLEQNKGRGLIHYMRWDDPCWKSRGDDNIICIDYQFMDDEGYHCGEYGDATSEECRAKDHQNSALTANEACCGCGGGMHDPKLENVEEEL